MNTIHIHTSVREKIQLFLWRPYAALGTLFFILGTIWMVSFAHECDFSSLLFYKTAQGQTGGIVRQIYQTELKDKYLHILEYTYEYTLGNDHYLTKSYGTDYTIEAGDNVPVEYVVSHPETSRIQGMKGAPFGLWLFFILAPFTIAGCIGMIVSIEKTKQIIDTLKNASIVSGKLLKKQIPFLKNQKTIRLDYFYSKQGCTYRNTTLTISPESFKDEEKILISATNHRASVLLNALPQAIRWKVRDVRAKQLAPCLN